MACNYYPDIYCDNCPLFEQPSCPYVDETKNEEEENMESDFSDFTMNSPTLAQSVEQGTENPRVSRSTREGGTSSLNEQAKKLCDEGICISRGEARRLILNKK